ncbi:MAG: hypothetical protein QXU54_01440 [Candidatus Micrarchaeia archaeon]
MFISTIYGPKRIATVQAMLAKVPQEIKGELEGTTIIYRGLVSLNGEEGDLLLRKGTHKLYNVVWKQDYGESRELDVNELNLLVKQFDSIMQNVVVRESNKTLEKMYIINTRVELKEREFKKVAPK